MTGRNRSSGGEPCAELFATVAMANAIDMKVAIHDAFRAAHRQLEDMLRKRQGHVKTHEGSPRGVIKSLLQNHAFIAAGDDRECYFHRNSVAAGGFDGFSVGEPISL